MMVSLSGEDAPAAGHQRLAEAINQLPGLNATARPGLDWREIGVAHETVVFGVAGEVDWWNALERLAIAIEEVEHATIQLRWQHEVFFEVICMTDQAADDLASAIEGTRPRRPGLITGLSSQVIA
jgi:hypothetical protein